MYLPNQPVKPSHRARAAMRKAHHRTQKILRGREREQRGGGNTPEQSQNKPNTSKNKPETKPRTNDTNKNRMNDRQRENDKKEPLQTHQVSCKSAHPSGDSLMKAWMAKSMGH